MTMHHPPVPLRTATRSTSSIGARSRAGETAWIIAILALLATAGIRAEPGHEPSPPEPARAEQPTHRVVSCAPNLTELLFAIGAGDQIVAVDNHSDFPPEAALLPRTGDLFSPDLEAIARLRPDIIATVPSNRAIRQYFGRRDDVTVIECSDANTLASIRKTVLLLAAATGTEAGGQALLERHDLVFSTIEATVMDFVRRARMAPTSVLVLFGREPGALGRPWVIHPDTYLGEMIATLRLVNVVPKELPLYVEVDLEAIVRWSPNVIVELQSLPADLDTPERRSDREAALLRDWSELGIYQGGVAETPRHVVVWGSEVTIPGARIDQTMCKLAVALRPHLFRQESGMALWREITEGRSAKPRERLEMLK
jgi:iron complex transport system substrate-binding protein